MDSNGKGKAHRRKPKEEKPYDRPPSVSFLTYYTIFELFFNGLINDIIFYLYI